MSRITFSRGRVVQCSLVIRDYQVLASPVSMDYWTFFQQSLESTDDLVQGNPESSDKLCLGKSDVQG